MLHVPRVVSDRHLDMRFLWVQVSCVSVHRDRAVFLTHGMVPVCEDWRIGTIVRRHYTRRLAPASWLVGCGRLALSPL